MVFFLFFSFISVFKPDIKHNAQLGEFPLADIFRSFASLQYGTWQATEDAVSFTKIDR